MGGRSSIVYVVGGVIAFAKAVLLCVAGATQYAVFFLVGSTAPIIAGIAGSPPTRYLAFASSATLLAMSLALGDAVLALGFALSALPHICTLATRYRVAEKSPFPPPSDAVSTANDRVLRVGLGKRYVRRKAGG